MTARLFIGQLLLVASASVALAIEVDAQSAERRAWFTHVRLAHDGTFVTVTDRHVYAGQL